MKKSNTAQVVGAFLNIFYEQMTKRSAFGHCVKPRCCGVMTGLVIKTI